MPDASWNETGIAIAGWSNRTQGSSLNQLYHPVGLSITNNDVLYIADQYNHRIVVVHLNSDTNHSIIGSGPGNSNNEFSYPTDVFVTNISLYVNDRINQRIQKLSLNGSYPTTVLKHNQPLNVIYFYVNNHGDVYMGDARNHRVLFYRSHSTNFTIVAGTGVQGSDNNQLYEPHGLFVNDIGTIYIADRFNHRIMKWISGAKFGIRVAGDGTFGSSSTQLSHPTQVLVDSNEYLYATEAGNNRVTRWAPNSTFGVCIVGCTGTAGSNPTQLQEPHSLVFDSNGSLYVSEWENHRVQKFHILPQSGKEF